MAALEREQQQNAAALVEAAAALEALERADFAP